MIKNAVAIAAGALALTLAAPGKGHAGDSDHGKYLASVMDCTGCHTPGAMKGEPDMTRYLSGGDVGFELPGFGIFYPRNLTPDHETGLGSWSKAQIIDAVTKGVRPDGRILAPIMPYHSYSVLTAEDADSLVSFLQSLPAVPNFVPDPIAPGEKAPLPYLTMKLPQ